MGEKQQENWAEHKIVYIGFLEGEDISRIAKDWRDYMTQSWGSLRDW